MCVLGREGKGGKGSSSREEILYGVGAGNRQYYGVCQYPGRDVIVSEACMAGVGSDVTHLGTAPAGNTTLPPLFIRTSVHRRNFLYADARVSVFGGRGVEGGEERDRAGGTK